MQGNSGKSRLGQQNIAEKFVSSSCCLGNMNDMAGPYILGYVSWPMKNIVQVTYISCKSS